MGRIARVVVPDCWHHVTQRGNHQQAVFLSDTDREFYLRVLHQHSVRYGLRLGGYCLMGNHVHLLAIPSREQALAQAIGRTHNDYARWFNFRQTVTGHLWQNRFYSCPLDATHRWVALRYIELNPVRAGLVERAEHWRWSSASAHVTGRDPRGLIEWTDWTAQWRPDSWKTALQTDINTASWFERIRESTRTGRPAGDDNFLVEIEAQIHRNLHPRKRGPKSHSAPAGEQMNLGVV